MMATAPKENIVRTKSSSRQEVHCPKIVQRVSTSRNGAIDTFHRGKILGRGGFAAVFEVERAADGRKFALKVVSKASLEKPRARAKLKTEIAIHETVRHEQVVRFLTAWDDVTNVYILLELCEGPTLADRVKAKGRLSETEAVRYMDQILEGMHHLHMNRIIHRDLKLSNLFLDHQGNVKIGDFGLACQLQYDGERKTTICGTPNYIAPEILTGQGGHSFEVDIWSLGVLIYAMVLGRPPFETSDVKKTYRRIKANDYVFPQDKPVSSEVKDLIGSILALEPHRRPTLADMALHPWMARFRAPGTPAPHWAVAARAKTMGVPSSLGPGSSSSMGTNPYAPATSGTSSHASHPSVSPGVSSAPMPGTTTTTTTTSQANAARTAALAAHGALDTVGLGKYGGVAGSTGSTAPVAAKPGMSPASKGRPLSSIAENGRTAMGSTGTSRPVSVTAAFPAAPTATTVSSNSTTATGTNPTARLEHRFAALGVGPEHLEGADKENMPLPRSAWGAPAPTTSLSSGLKVPMTQAPYPTTTTTTATAAAVTHAWECPREPLRPVVVPGVVNEASVRSSVTSTTTGSNSTNPGLAPEDSDASAPWVVRWVDYSSKYGLGYLLSDGTVGVIFNDQTRIMLPRARTHFCYQDRKSSSTKSSASTSTSGQGPRVFHVDQALPEDRDLKKKVTLMWHFDRYLFRSDARGLVHAARAVTHPGQRPGGTGPSEAALGPMGPAERASWLQRWSRLEDQIAATAGVFYAKKWVKTRHATIFRLSDRAVQVEFVDGSSLRLCGGERRVVFTSKVGIVNGYAMQALPEDPHLAKRLQYAQDVLSQVGCASPVAA